MAKNKAPRKKAPARKVREADHVNRVIQIAMANFQIVGDQSHTPRAFGFSRLSEYLKGDHRELAKREIVFHLFHEEQIWSVLILFFFKNGENIEVYPVHLELEQMTLGQLGADFEEVIADARKALLASEEHLNEDMISFYGYLTTFGGGLNLEKMEDQLSKSFLAISKDLTDIGPKVDVNGQSMANAIAADKFSIVNRAALKSNFSQKAE